MIIVIGVILLLGGLLYGMYLTRTALSKLASNASNIPLIAKSTLLAFLIGIVLAITVQHSLVAIVILVAWVTASSPSFQQSIAIVLGINLGASIDILPVDYELYVAPMAITGALLYYVRKGNIRSLGYLLMGIATMLGALWGLEKIGYIFFQMIDVNEMVPVIKSSQLYTLLAGVVTHLFGNVEGLLLNGEVACLLGGNVGLALFALIALVGSSKVAYDVVRVYVGVNIVGVLLCYPFIEFLEASIPGDYVNLVFNSTISILAFPIIYLLSMLKEIKKGL
ncbi:Na/Pi symporter [Ornithinibacillus californiensis]|uniref:Na/Pi symporter n=1 Tax=Ornithinibacillus californiensis TaxID=161536 RepID=UPI00064D9F79|nr:Na/Pi symporter [Ornithinibacillus californiensis]